MWSINSNQQIPAKRYFLYVTDNSGIATSTNSHLSKRMSYSYKNLYATDAGFIGNGTTFLSLIQGADISDVEDRLKVTDIVVCGGYNDKSKGIDNVKSAMETFAYYCKQYYPLAKVWVGMTGWADVGINTSSVVNTTWGFKDVLEYYAWAGAYGMCYMTNIQYATHFSDFYDDTYTLNSTGLDYLGSHIAECLLNGSTNVFEVKNATATYRSGCSAIDSTRILTGMSNGMVSLYLRNGSSGYCGFAIPAQSLTPKTRYAMVPICDLTGVWCAGRVNEYPLFASEWQYVTNLSGSTALEYECRLVLQGRTLCVQCRSFASATTNFSVVRFPEVIKMTNDAMYC